MEYIAEFGGNVRFLHPSCVKMYNSENEEIEIPKCEYCGNYKSQILGKESFMNYCTICNK